MYPESDIKNKYKIANASKTQTREPKPLSEIKLIDPATGSGNFLLYAFDLFYDLYTDQVENYGADYDSKKIAELIIAHNLHGVDLDDRAIQIAQLGLYIKAKRKKRTAKIEHFNIVSADFYLPEYSAVKDLFEEGGNLDERQKKIIKELWTDLQQAYKFGSLIRLEEKLSLHTHAMVEQFKGSLFTVVSSDTLKEVEQFKTNFFANLQLAVAHNTSKQGQTFLNTKTQDAITFLQVLTQKYDVAVANPPYTPSSEYGEELRNFIDTNYKNNINVYENLYSCFIQRNIELTNEESYIAMITPQTFMFIDSFKDLRMNILSKTQIEILVQYGFGGIFKESIDPAFFILNKIKTERLSIFVKFDNIFNSSKNEEFNNIIQNSFQKALYDKNIFYLEQKKFFEIKAQPFIYWISDSLRIKFQEGVLNNYLKICQGLATGDNSRFLRFHWEVEYKSINSKWIFYAKGGTFNKWVGNIWLTVNWESNGFEIKNFKDNNGKVRSRAQNESFYFKDGITYSASGRGGYAFRYLPSGCIFDVGGSSIFLTNKYNKIYYVLGFLNSKFAFYIADCLNPTANIQVGDLQRLPFVIPAKEHESIIEALVRNNIELLTETNCYKLVEPNSSKSVIFQSPTEPINAILNNRFSYENGVFAVVLINEAIINKLITKVYGLSDEDQIQVDNKIGKPIGCLPILKEAQNAFINEYSFMNAAAKDFIANLENTIYDENYVNDVVSKMNKLHQGHYDFEDFCIEHQINPINIWHWFKINKLVPKDSAAKIALETLADVCRALLMEDENGIIQLVSLSGELKLVNIIEKYWQKTGLSSSQFMQLDKLLGCPISEYLENYFFEDLSNLLNLFSNLPKTPFIWHLSSGERQGFECYIIIYKWNRDSLYKLKSSYLSKRTESLQYRLQQIADNNSAPAQIEKETIRLQLQEIDTFAKKIDELIAEGYDPKLDDGVGKNIAPLQKKGMLRAEVLNKKQLEKYLNAEW